MSKSKRHHYASQVYLKGFAANKKQIHALDKVTLRSGLVGLRDVAVAEHFHKFPTEDIPSTLHPYLRQQLEEIARYETEERLSMLEGLYATMLRKLVDTVRAVSQPTLWLPHSPLDLDDRAVLAQFIVVTFTRTLEYRTRMRDFYKKAWAAINSTVLAREVGEDEEPCAEKFWPLLHVREIFRSDIDDIVADLISRVWIVGVNRSELPFYASDNPVIRRPVMLDGVVQDSFAGRGMELALPLNSKYILIIRDRNLLQNPTDVRLDGRVIYLDVRGVTTYNREQVIQSYRQVFAEDGNFSLAKLVCSEQDRPDTRRPDRDRYRIESELDGDRYRMKVEETLWDEMRNAVRTGQLRKEVGERNG